MKKQRSVKKFEVVRNSKKVKSANTVRMVARAFGSKGTKRERIGEPFFDMTVRIYTREVFKLRDIRTIVTAALEKELSNRKTPVTVEVEDVERDWWC